MIQFSMIKKYIVFINIDAREIKLNYLIYRI